MSRPYRRKTNKGVVNVSSRRGKKIKHNSKSTGSFRYIDGISIGMVGILGTIILFIAIPSNPEYFYKPVEITYTSRLAPVIFIITAFLVYIPFMIHNKVTSDDSTIKNKGFYIVYGGIVGVFFGEVLFAFSPANFILVIPYMIILSVYAYLFANYEWQEVALTTLLGGMIVENVINRSQLQATSTIWIGIFLGPYFITKVYENRSSIRIDLGGILRDTLMISLILAVGAYFFSTQVGKNEVSPPLIFLGIVIPFITYLPYRISKG